MIPDPILRELFRAESEEHLQQLDDALLRLEKTPADQALLEEAFRGAHSLKGSARMLGLNAIQGPARRLEDEFNAARHGTQLLNADVLARMAVHLNEIRRQVKEAVATSPAAVATSPATVATSPAAVATSPAAVPAAPPQRAAGPDAGAAPAVVVAARPAIEPDSPPPESSAPFLIETVRVETHRLDALMTHAEELAVTRTRVESRLAEIDTLLELAEEQARRETARGSAADDPGNSAAMEQFGRMPALLDRLRADLAADCARLGHIADELVAGIRVVRMVPLSNVFRLFPRLVHDLAREQGKQAELRIEGEQTSADKRILEQIKDPLMHLLRNAVDHGIETPQERLAAGKPQAGSICIKASRTPASVVIAVSDDGRGVDEEGLKHAAAKQGLASQEALAAMSPGQARLLAFAAGISTAAFVTDVSGRGVGMGVVRTNVERLKGTVELQSVPGRGTVVTMVLPRTLSSLRVLIVEVNGHAYGLPMECVQVLRTIARAEIFPLEGRDAIQHEGTPVPVARLADLLDLRQQTPPVPSRAGREASPCVVLFPGGERFAVLVDALLDEREVVLKPQSALLERVRNIAGAAILDHGEICMVLHPQDLLATIRKGAAPVALREVLRPAMKKKSVLLAEDTITTRMLETRILETAGYEVVTAVDGQDAWEKLAKRTFDAVVSDVMMPKLTGLALAEKIRGEAKYAELPIVLVTSLASDADRQRGMVAGANAYLAKSAFDYRALVECLERLT